MKKLLLIPVLALVCAACDNDSCCNGSNNGVMSQDASQENSADWVITTKVKAEILADTSISASARFVSVSTTNGIVTLTGSVPTRGDRYTIVKIAKGVKGVVRVDNQITIANN